MPLLASCVIRQSRFLSGNFGDRADSRDRLSVRGYDGLSEQKRPTTRQCRGPPVGKSMARCYLPLLAFVIDVATICHVPPLRDHTCRL